MFRRFGIIKTSKGTSSLYAELGRVGLRLDLDARRIYVDGSQYALSAEKYGFLLQPYFLSLMVSLVETSSAKLRVSPDEELVISLDDISLVVRTNDELYQYNEIFALGCYNIVLPYPIVVWDIGMNVGAASLFFAHNANVSQVFAFEPFPRTFELAKGNLSLNPSLAQKIRAFNYGVGRCDSRVELEYSETYKGSSGILGLKEEWKRTSDISRVTVNLRSAVAILDMIHAEAPNTALVAKIDCEGAEYEIVEALQQANLLSQLKAVVIEWHYLGPEPLVNALISSGFTIVSLTPLSKSIGMLYAVNGSS